MCFIIIIVVFMVLYGKDPKIPQIIFFLWDEKILTFF